MTYQRRRNREKIGGAVPPPPPPPPPHPPPISILSDEILLEIFLRLMDFKCIVECAFVCKRWFSAIADSKSYFSTKFNHFHRQKRLNDSSSSSLPFTLLFRRCCNENKITPPFSWEFFSERSKTLDYGETPALGFLPWRGDKSCSYVWSSFEDLLLVERSPTRVNICNPLTKQCVEIPGSPHGFDKHYAYALVVLRDRHNYKVVRISSNAKEFGRDDTNTASYLFHLSIFCSETKEWSRWSFKFSVPWFRGSTTVVVGSNGIVYWPYGYHKIDGVVALNPCSRRCRSIDLPKECCVCFKAHFGVVRGRLRVVQFYLKKKNMC